MTVNDWIRLIAGTFVLGSLVLGWTVSPWSLAFTAFVAVNLVQSAFTKTCPMMKLLRWAGVPD